MHKRFVRIVPFLWFVVIGYGLLRITARGVFPLGAYLRALVLWPVGTIEPTVVWTLRHEMLFYGVFALSFLGARKRPWLLVIWALSPLVAFPMRSQVGEGVYRSGELFRFVFHPVNLLFGAGVLTAYVFRRVSGRMAVRTTWMATLAGLVLVAAVSLALHYDRKSLAHVPVVGLFCSLAIFLAAGQGHIPGRLGRLGILLGDASYSIYLTHLAAVSALLGLAARFPAYFPDALLLAECVIGSCVFGTLVHLMVEKPLLRWVRHRWTPSAGRARPSPKPELA